MREPLVVLVSIAVFGCAGILSSPKVRAAFTVLGGLLVLQSSAGLSVPKLAYLGGVILCFVVGVRRASGRESARLALWPSALLGAVLVISIIIATARGVPASAWTRDLVAYALLAVSPVLARDFAQTGRRFLVRLFVMGGVLATASFAVEWIGRHHIATLPLSQFALSSFAVVSATFAYAVASLLVTGGRRAAWRALAVLVPAALLLTGTRTTVALVAAPIAMLVSPRLRSFKRMTKLAAAAGAAVALVAVFLAAGGVGLGSVVGSAVGRVASLAPSSAAPGTGGSNAARLVVTRLAWHTFESAPVLGVGAGHLWTYPIPYGTSNGFGINVSSVTLDTTVAVPAKFGVVGLIALSLFMGSLGAAMWRHRPTAPSVAIVGFLATFVVSSIATNPFDDKGLGLTLALLLAMALAADDGQSDPTAQIRPKPSATLLTPSSHQRHPLPRAAPAQR